MTKNSSNMVGDVMVGRGLTNEYLAKKTLNVLKCSKSLRTFVKLNIDIASCNYSLIFARHLFATCLQRVYVTCGRQIKRIDSVSRSPLYAFFSETLNGVSSIRAYDQQRRFTAQADLLLDTSQRVWFESFSSNRSAKHC